MKSAIERFNRLNNLRDVIGDVKQVEVFGSDIMACGQVVSRIVIEYLGCLLHQDAFPDMMTTDRLQALLF